MSSSDLSARECQACSPGAAPLHAQQVAEFLKQVPGWGYRDGLIEKTFQFKDFWETMAFVNAVAWIAHQQDHHPDMEVGYSRCVVRYSTHSIGGLSENDFICAAKVEALRP